MKPKSWDWLIFLLFGILVFFHFSGFHTGTARNLVGEKWLSFLDSSDIVAKDNRTMLLFILDFRDFSCPTCLESFLNLYQKLPLWLKIHGSWGVLVVPVTGEGVDRTRIAETKLRGFCRANHILSPFLVDRHQVFGELAADGSCAILFAKRRQVIHMFRFPLRDGHFETILQALAD
jgi:hypothetical protein